MCLKRSLMVQLLKAPVSAETATEYQDLERLDYELR